MKLNDLLDQLTSLQSKEDTKKFESKTTTIDVLFHKFNYHFNLTFSQPDDLIGNDKVNKRQRQPSPNQQIKK